MTNEHKQNNISNDLIEAYKGTYENTVEHRDGEPSTEWVINKIQEDRPKVRLEIYLNWNGIIGYTNRIWEITQGEL